MASGWKCRGRNRRFRQDPIRNARPHVENARRHGRKRPPTWPKTPADMAENVRRHGRKRPPTAFGGVARREHDPLEMAARPPVAALWRRDHRSGVCGARPPVGGLWRRDHRSGFVGRDHRSGFVGRDHRSRLYGGVTTGRGFVGRDHRSGVYALKISATGSRKPGTTSPPVSSSEVVRVAASCLSS